jgi:ferritin
VSSGYSRKSNERKILRRFITSVSEKCAKINKSFEERKKIEVASVHVPELIKEYPALKDHASRVFLKQYTSDLKSELDLVKSGFKSVIDRINLGKV